MNEELTLLLKQVKDKWGRETVQAILRKIDSYPIRWKGTLRRSIMYQQEEGPDGDINLLMADYGKFIDEGIGLQGPRKSPIPKKSIAGIAFHIKPWADSKGLNAWAVATNIQKRGGFKSGPRPFFNSVIDQRVEVLGESITKAYTDYLNQSIENFNKEQ